MADMISFITENEALLSRDIKLRIVGLIIGREEKKTIVEVGKDKFLMVKLDKISDGLLKDIYTIVHDWRESLMLPAP